MSTIFKYDLATVSGVEGYVANTVFATTRVSVLAGGTRNFTYRLHLANPYHGHSTLVLKHGKQYAACYPGIPLSLDRQEFEAKALQQVRQSPACTSLVKVPELHYFDQDAHILIMDDCGENSLNLKQLMVSATPPPAVACEIGTSLGEFLGKLHHWSAGDSSLLDFFDENEQGKRLTAWTTYGRLIPTLTSGKVAAVNLLPEPVAESDLADLRALVAERMAEINYSRSAFTMGDFWTGNVVVNVSDPQTSTGTPSFTDAYIIDWELAKPGIPALDVSHFCAEMHCITLLNPEAAPSSTALIEAFLTAYRAHCGEMAPHMANTAAKHIGAHLVTITPLSGLWGAPEESVKAVAEGLSYLKNGGSDTWVRESSIFAPLL